MKNTLKNSVVIAVLLATSFSQAAALNCEIAPDYESAEFQALRKDVISVCSFLDKTSLSLDEQFLLNKWGQQICTNLTESDYDYLLQCRYKKMVDEKKLNSAEAMAVAGYTAEYYNYLNPKNLSKKPSESGYEGYDVFNRVLVSAIAKLNQDPQFQNNEVTYRGSSLHGRTYKVGDVITIDRWYSSSCVTEIAFGPEVLRVSKAEEEKIRAENPASEGEDLSWLENLFYVRDPQTVPKVMTKCQKVYYSENDRPPLTAESHFGRGDLSITILPPEKSHSKKVEIYSLSSRRNEAEVLLPIGTQLIVRKVINPNDSGGDGIKTQLFLQELSQ